MRQPSWQSLLGQLSIIRERLRGLWDLARTHKRVAIPLVCVLAFALAGGAYAWLTRTAALDNLFGWRDVQPEVVETLSDGTKSNVTVRNDGKATSYVRCQVEVYWRDADGNRLWETPTLATDGTSGTGDYTLAMATSASTSPTAANSWVKGADGFWYWTSPLAVGASTSTALITEAKQLKAYSGSSATSAQLVVDITTQAIQAEPDPSITSNTNAGSTPVVPVWAAWGATLDSNGVLTPKAAETKAGS